MVWRRAFPPPDDAGDPVVAAAKRGDEDAWRRLVEEFGPAIRGFARARGVPDADGLTQDVFLDVSRSIASFEGDSGAFRSWIFTIAYRRVADHHRRSARRPRTVADDARLADRPTAFGLPESSAEASETWHELLEALAGMSDLDRDVLVLRFVGELSSDQIAAVVGRTPGNVRVIQSRALDKLRKNLRTPVTPRPRQRLPL